MDEHANGAFADAQLEADVAVAATLDGDRQEGVALLLGKRCDLAERLAHGLAALDLGVRVVAAGHRVVGQQRKVA